MPPSTDWASACPGRPPFETSPQQPHTGFGRACRASFLTLVEAEIAYQQRPRHAVYPGMAWPWVDHQYGGLYGLGAERGRGARKGWGAG
jgi:hypothetical protein